MKQFQVGKKYKMLTDSHATLEKGEVFTVSRTDFDGDAFPYIGVCVSLDRLLNGEVVAVDDNEMPELEAGKHVVLMSYKSLGASYYLVLEANGKLFGKQIDDERYFSSKLCGDILEIHTLPLNGVEVFNPSVYNEHTLIWKRDDKKDKLREEHEQLQKQIAELQAKANDIGKLI